MSISEIFAAVGMAEKFIPVLEQIAGEIGPVVKAEIADGEEVWTDVEKAITDLKAAFAVVKSTVQSATK